MKTFATVLAFAFATSVSADCTLSFMDDYNSGMSEGLVGPKSYKRMVRILEGKGYMVQKDYASRKTAEYVLDVDTYFGYDCGTGLTWVDYMIVPSYFQVKMSRNHGNVVFERERSYSLPVVVGGGKLLPRKMLMKAIRAIPKCGSSERGQSI